MLEIAVPVSSFRRVLVCLRGSRGRRNINCRVAIATVNIPAIYHDYKSCREGPTSSGESVASTASMCHAVHTCDHT